MIPYIATHLAAVVVVVVVDVVFVGNILQKA